MTRKTVSKQRIVATAVRCWNCQRLWRVPGVVLGAYVCADCRTQRGRGPTRRLR